MLWIEKADPLWNTFFFLMRVLSTIAQWKKASCSNINHVSVKSRNWVHEIVKDHVRTDNSTAWKKQNMAASLISLRQLFRLAKKISFFLISMQYFLENILSSQLVAGRFLCKANILRGHRFVICWPLNSVVVLLPFLDVISSHQQYATKSAIILFFKRSAVFSPNRQTTGVAEKERLRNKALSLPSGHARKDTYLVSLFLTVTRKGALLHITIQQQPLLWFEKRSSNHTGVSEIQELWAGRFSKGF